MQEIMVSVVCLTFNHEKYLRKTLEGFVRQKTDFDYEVIIHDDASTDGTAKIIREYQEKYPHLVKPVFQKENQYSQGISITKEHILPRIKGKYVALCEGDDFWCDESKLQKQVDALEKHPECMFSAHIVQRIDKEGNALEGTFPARKMDEGFLTLNDLVEEEFKKERWFLHLSSYLIRADVYSSYMRNKPEFSRAFYRMGDLPMVLYLLSLGNAWFVACPMSCYRVLSGGVMSKMAQDRAYAVKVAESKICGLTLFDDYSRGKYHDALEEAVCAEEIRVFSLKREYEKLRNRKYIRHILRHKKNPKSMIWYVIAIVFPKLARKIAS